MRQARMRAPPQPSGHASPVGQWRRPEIGDERLKITSRSQSAGSGVVFPSAYLADDPAGCALHNDGFNSETTGQ